MVLLWYPVNELSIVYSCDRACLLWVFSVSEEMSRKQLNALGSQRDSLSTNPLLVTSELGKPRSRCFSLPPSDFTYGIKNTRLDGGAAEALAIWDDCKYKEVGKKKPEKDFVKLNRLAAQSGLTTAHEQTQFRACNDIRRPSEEEERERRKSQHIIPEDMVFGISTRPSTPIFELLENRYQEKWLNERREAERKERHEINKKKLHGKVYETRASLLRRYPEPVDPPPYWKISRFSKIPANVQTFRSEELRDKAFTYHNTESSGRQGMYGHGIHQTA